jgi:uncharacterized protein YkwD
MKHLFVLLTAALLMLSIGGSAALADQVNAYRKANGAKALNYSQKLEKAATRHVQDMVKGNFRSHTGSNGSSVGDRVRSAGYKWCHVSENITWGRSSLAKAIAAWDASSGHKKNLLNRKPRDYGVAQSSG